MPNAARGWTIFYTYSSLLSTRRGVKKEFMLRFSYVVISLLLALVLGSTVAANAKRGTHVKDSLQIAMQQHIDRSLVNGAYLHFDPTTGDVSKLYPVSPHPTIMRMGKFFVLCADFRDDKGVPVNVDFYVAQAERRYVVFYKAVAQRNMLKRLMKAGKIERLD